MRVRTTFMAVLFSTFACSMPAMAEAPTQSDAAAIGSLENGFAAAFRARDVPKIMSYFAPGNDLLVFDVMTPRQFAGADAYRKDWESFTRMTDKPFSVEIQNFRIMSSDGKLAFSNFVHHVTGTLNDGTRLDMSTRVTHDYEKINGKWLIVQEHVSVPIDWASGKPDWHSKP